MVVKDSDLVKFLAIVTLDIFLFSIAIFIWAKYRKRIIYRAHHGFSNRNKRFEKLMREMENIKKNVLDHEDVKRPGLFENNDADLEDVCVRSPGESHITRFNSISVEPYGLYVDMSNNADNDSTPCAEKLLKALNKLPMNKKWWEFLFFTGPSKVKNNEAKLYLSFMSQNYNILLSCFMSSVIINAIVFVHYVVNKKKYILLVYSFEDMLNCRVTAWALYLMTWVYCLIAYYFIYHFRNDIMNKKQVTAILRPQLHTIMVSGFEKSVTNPSVIYNHFDSYFPGQIIAAHMVMRHDKRLSLESALENAKLQIAGLCDIASTALGHNSGFQSIMTSNYSNDDQHHKSADAGGHTKFVRSSTINCGAMFNKPDNSGIRKSLSFTNINKAPHERNAITRSKSIINKEIYECYGGMKQVFIKHVDQIDKIKKSIEDERNKPHTTSARVCFISFADSNLVLHILKDCKILESKHKWNISPAPHPSDIIWKNLHISQTSVIFRTIISNILTVLFYVGVTYLLSKFNMIKRFTKNDPGFTVLANGNQDVKDSFWHGLIQSFITITINSCVHPQVILMLSYKIGFWTQGSYQTYLFFIHAFYMLTITIFVPLLASMIAIWQLFNGAINLLSAELGKMLINTSWTYGTIYVINATFLGTINPLLQTSQTLYRYLYQQVFNYDTGTPNFDLGFWYAYHLATFTLVLLFSVFVPYLLILGVIYFIIRYYVDRHNISFRINEIHIDSAGNISTSVVKVMLVCVSLVQFIMSGVFANCQNILPRICIIILHIAPVTTWLLLYGSNCDSVIESVVSFYTIKLKPLNRKMIQIIQVCYMHPCDVKDLINFKAIK